MKKGFVSISFLHPLPTHRIRLRPQGGFQILATLSARGGPAFFAHPRPSFFLWRRKYVFLERKTTESGSGKFTFDIHIYFSILQNTWIGIYAKRIIHYIRNSLEVLLLAILARTVLASLLIIEITTSLFIFPESKSKKCFVVFYTFKNRYVVLPFSGD